MLHKNYYDRLDKKSARKLAINILASSHAASYHCVIIDYSSHKGYSIDNRTESTCFSHRHNDPKIAAFVYGDGFWLDSRIYRYLEQLRLKSYYDRASKAYDYNRYEDISYFPNKHHGYLPKIIYDLYPDEDDRFYRGIVTGTRWEDLLSEKQPLRY